MWEEMVGASERAGFDPAHVHAAREIGYLVTQDNQHLFFAMEVEAWRDAVLRFRGDPDDDAEELEAADDTLHCLANRFELVVEETLLSDGDEQPQLRFVEALVNALEANDSDEAAAVLVFGCLMSWLVAAKERGIDSAAVVAWTNEHLSVDAAGAAVRVSGPPESAVKSTSGFLGQAPGGRYKLGRVRYT